MTRTVAIETREVGQRFGCQAIVRDARSNRKLAVTETVRPYGFDAAAYHDGEILAESRGWWVEDDES